MLMLYKSKLRERSVELQYAVLSQVYKVTVTIIAQALCDVKVFEMRFWLYCSSSTLIPVIYS